MKKCFYICSVMFVDWRKKYSFKQLFGIEDKTNYPLNPTRNEIRNVLSGKKQVRYGKSIHAAATYLRTNENPSSMARGADSRKGKEQEILKQYVSKNNLRIDIDPTTEVGKGGTEQKVYRYDKESLIKTNNLHYYLSWKDYFNSLLLHNYFFEDTAYDLIGFTEQDGKLAPVVKQKFIQGTEPTDIEEVRKFITSKGFTSDEDLSYNYTNKELGVRLDDLHRLNVLTRENPVTKEKVLHFIDTIFYVLPSVFE